MAKNEIRNFLFHYQMIQFSPEPPFNYPQPNFVQSRSNSRSQDLYQHGFVSPEGSTSSSVSYTELLASSNS